MEDIDRRRRVVRRCQAPNPDLNHRMSRQAVGTTWRVWVGLGEGLVQTEIQSDMEGTNRRSLVQGRPHRRLLAEAAAEAEPSWQQLSTASYLNWTAWIYFRRPVEVSTAVPGYICRSADAP